MGLKGGAAIYTGPSPPRAVVTAGRHVRDPRHKIGIVPMTRRSDIIKIFIVAALLGAAFYYLAHYGLSLPQSTS